MRGHTARLVVCVESRREQRATGSSIGPAILACRPAAARLAGCSARARSSSSASRRRCSAAASSGPQMWFTTYFNVSCGAESMSSCAGSSSPEGVDDAEGDDNAEGDDDAPASAFRPPRALPPPCGQLNHPRRTPLSPRRHPRAAPSPLPTHRAPRAPTRRSSPRSSAASRRSRWTAARWTRSGASCAR